MPAVKRSVPARLSRRGRAKATHWRIVKAAYTLFCARGYAGTTMAQIAEAAGVAVQTVYFAFHTKSTLLSRAYDFAVMGEDEPLSPDKQPWFGAMTAEQDVEKALRHLVTGVGEITRRVTPLYLVARVAADGDPDAARVMAFHERWAGDGWSDEEWTDWAVSTAAEQIFGRYRGGPGVPVRGGRFSPASRRRDHDATQAGHRHKG